jgi:hypothetical protein
MSVRVAGGCRRASTSILRLIVIVILQLRSCSGGHARSISMPLEAGGFFEIGAEKAGILIRPTSNRISNGIERSGPAVSLAILRATASLSSSTRKRRSHVVLNRS